ncbi:MAG TPA: hypothetical protein PLJ35_08755 [Anaerolineae bacterium]|nr:hypothetical protein [Anaerolineae bacterium]HOQ98898.1 hypothetical protein [Anaerolineae bacterium]HPL29269.1 hypothetical protein [Anaerolineae bacterium]
MNTLVPLGLYEYVWNRPPLPEGALLARVASPHARRTYQFAIDMFHWRVERDPGVAKPPAIADYVAVTTLRYGPHVAALHLRVVRELYDEGVAAGAIVENPAAHVPAPELSPDPGVRVPQPDVAARRAPTCRRHTEAGRREYALCLLVSQTAIRADEVSRLQVSDYRQEDGRPMLYLQHGTGPQAPRLGLPPDVAAALDAYLATRSVADDSPLFGLPRLRARHVPRPAA